jgi:hypothetical protein
MTDPVEIAANKAAIDWIIATAMVNGVLPSRREITAANRRYAAVRAVLQEKG